jgi:hypothetical protein
VISRPGPTLISVSSARFGGEHRDQLVEVTAIGGVQEAPGHLALLAAVHSEPGPPGLDVLAGPVRELAHRGVGAVQGRADLGVAEAEYLPEHEDGAFLRGQRLQHHEHRQDTDSATTARSA